MVRSASMFTHRMMSLLFLAEYLAEVIRVYMGADKVALKKQQINPIEI